MRVAKTILLSAALAFVSHASAQALYTVTDLGRLPGYTYMTVPLGLNNRGEVVGFAYGTATYKAFIWDAEHGIRALPPVPGEETRSSTALAINDLGEIIGYSGQSGGSHSVGWLYRNGQYTLLGTLPGYDGCLPASINNNTEIVGSATGYDGLSPDTNFYWSPATGMVNVVPGQQTELYAINDAGVICGGIRDGEPAVGIMTWDMRTGTVSDLGMLPGSALSFGYGINESGRVAGASIYITSGGHRTSRAVFVQPGSDMVDIGIDRAVASAINEHGEIVGWRPYASNSTYYSWVYSPQRGLILDVSTVVEEPQYFAQISEARSINDRGQFIAIGSNGHFPNDLSRRGLLLTPIVQCAVDFDGDGFLTGQDFDLFVQAFEYGDPSADFDQNGFISGPDFDLYVVAFEAGC